MALGLGDPSKAKPRRKTVSNGQMVDGAANAMSVLQQPHNHQTIDQKSTCDEDYIFPLDEDHMVETPTPATNIPMFGAQLFKNRKTSPIQLTTTPGALKQRFVNINHEKRHVYFFNSSFSSRTVCVIAMAWI